MKLIRELIDKVNRWDIFTYYYLTLAFFWHGAKDITVMCALFILSGIMMLGSKLHKIDAKLKKFEAERASERAGKAESKPQAPLYG